MEQQLPFESSHVDEEEEKAGGVALSGQVAMGFLRLDKAINSMYHLAHSWGFEDAAWLSEVRES
jgi:hypothetical protein